MFSRWRINYNDKHIVTIILILVTLSAIACGAAAPPTPTSAPAPEPTAAPPAAEATSPPATEATSAPAATVAPTPVPTPTTTPAAPQAGKDTLTIALPNEPGNGSVYMMTTTESAWIGNNIAEPVSIIAKSTMEDAPLSGFTGWEQVSTSVWRLSLRDGVKFHNGEPWTAEEAKFTFDFYGNSVNNAPNYAFLGDTTTKVIDPKTVEVTCVVACPIFPRFTGFLNFLAPEWYQNASDAEKATSNVGFGPLKHVEYRIGEVWKAERYEDYVPVPDLAEGAVPTIREVTWVFRAETGVRLAMLQTGEADLALRLDLDDADNMPAFAIGAEGSVMTLRFDTIWNPLLAKKEIRQALMHAIDCPTMAQSFYKGFAECLGVPAPLGVLGVTEENIKPLHEYNPDKAKELLAQAGYNGEEVRVRMREGRFPKDVEMGEAIVSYWNDVGVNAKLLVMESSKWLDLHQTGPGAFPPDDWSRLSQLPPPPPGLTSPDVLFAAPGNDTLDFGRNLAFYMDCRSERAKVCDPVNLQPKVEAALAAIGPERERLLAEAMEINRQEIYMAPLFDTVFLWGFQENLEFEPAVGGRRIVINTIRWK